MRMYSHTYTHTRTPFFTTTTLYLRTTLSDSEGYAIQPANAHTHPLMTCTVEMDNCGSRKLSLEMN